MLKNIFLIALSLISSSAFAGPSWIMCEGPRSQIQLQTTIGRESLYFGPMTATVQPRQVKVIEFNRLRCPMCFNVAAEDQLGRKNLVLTVRGVRRGNEFVPTGTLVVSSSSARAGSGRSETLSCRSVRAIH